MLVQATPAGKDDGDFVIPTLKPLHKGGSRHGILLTPTHEAAQSRASEQANKQSGSRKTSFRLVAQDAAEYLPEEQLLSLQQQQQQQQSKKLSFETQEQAQSEEGSVTSQTHQEAMTEMHDSVPVGDEAQELAKSQGVNKQQLGHTQSQSLKGASPAKQTQRKTKPMQPIHDWVGFGSKRQLHK